MKAPSGFVVWRGLSPLDGAPIVMIATGVGGCPVSAPVVPAWVWALAIMVPCPECGADGGELCRVDCTGEASMVAAREDGAS